MTQPEKGDATSFRAAVVHRAQARRPTQRRKWLPLLSAKVHESDDELQDPLAQSIEFERGGATRTSGLRRSLRGARWTGQAPAAGCRRDTWCAADHDVFAGRVATRVTSRGVHRRRERLPLRFRLIQVVAFAVLALGTVVQLGTRPALGDVSLATGGRPVDAALFATGSCISFAPTSGNRHETVFLDAGHGGVDPGAVGTTEARHTIYEADETLPVELAVAALLRGHGFEVVVSRTGTSSVARLGPGDVVEGAMTEAAALEDVTARVRCANLIRASVLVGIYFDAGASPRNAGCVTAYDPDRSFSRRSYALATLIQHDVLRAMNSHGWKIPDVGVLRDSGLGAPVGPFAEAASYHHLLLLGPSMAGYLSTPSQMPGTVIEPLFLTDPFEASIAASVVGQKTIASGIATAIEQYLGEHQ